MSKTLQKKQHSKLENECILKTFSNPAAGNNFQKAIKKAFLFSFCLAITFLTLSGTAKAQNGISVTSIKKDASSSEWHLYKQIDGVNLYYQYVDCGPVGNIFFKVENTTNNIASVSWKYKYFHENRELETNPDDVNVALKVNNQSTLSGNCNNSGDGLMVFVKEGSSPFLISEIELSNLSVSQAK